MTNSQGPPPGMPSWQVELAVGGVSVSRLAFGTSRLFRLHSSKERQRLLHLAFDLGITHFDTARSYGLGAAEEELGRFLASPPISARRDAITIATKFGIPVSRIGRSIQPFQTAVRRFVAGFPALQSAARRHGGQMVCARRYSVEEAAYSLRASRSALRTSTIDLLLLHEPSANDPIAPALSDWFRENSDRQYFRTWGVSGGISDVLSIHTARPEIAVVCQYSSDAISRIRAARIPPRPRISFRPFADSLPVIQAVLNDCYAAAAEWRRTLGLGTDSAAIATMLLAEAVAPPHDSCVVFSTTSCQRLTALVEAVRQPLATEQIVAFRSWLNRFAAA
jgi:D-threo-aldose 1-dehydrogenase